MLKLNCCAAALHWDLAVTNASALFLQVRLWFLLESKVLHKTEHLLPSRKQSIPAEGLA